MSKANGLVRSRRAGFASLETLSAIPLEKQSVYRLMTLLVLLGGCASTRAAVSERADSEAMKVVLAALEHHLPGVSFESDSVAFDIEDVTPAQARMTEEIAARFGRPLVPGWELVSCDAEITYPRRCEIRGFDRIVHVGVPRFEGNRAVVGVGSTWESNTRVHGNVTTYELERRSGQWVVTKALRTTAT